MTAMLSRASERVGLEWRKPPCPEPLRLDDWFSGVACADSQRPAPDASLPEVHEEFTGRGRHLLLPETNLLTPPPSPLCGAARGYTGVPPVGGGGGPPRGAVSCYASVSLYRLPLAGGNRASSSGPVGTRLVSSGEAYVACGDAASTLRYGVTAGSSG